MANATEEKHERSFRGCYCPAELFMLVENSTINIKEAWLLMVIDSFVHNTGNDCYASNEYLGARIQTDVRQVSNYVAHLVELGLIIKTEFDGRRRFLKTCWSRIDMQKIAREPSKKLLGSLAKNCIQNKRELNKSEFKVPATGAAPLIPLIGKDNSGTETSAAFQQEFVSRWKAKYPKQSIVDSASKKEWMAIKTLHSRLSGDMSKWKRALSKFFANDKAFFHGHMPSKLLNQFAEFILEQPEESAEEQGPAVLSHVMSEAKQMSIAELYEKVDGPDIHVLAMRARKENWPKDCDLKAEFLRIEHPQRFAKHIRK